MLSSFTLGADLRKVTGTLFLSLSLIRASCQTAPEAQRTLQKPSAEAPYTLRVTTREVVIDLVARNRDNQPVTDLKETDLQVVEIPKHSQKLVRKITSFHIVDPSVEEADGSASTGGFQIKLGGGCAVRTTFHYRVAFQPSSEGWKRGYHEILVTTTRQHVTLSYHHRYYVGEIDLPAKPRIHNGSFDAIALQQAACYHSETPPSIALNARLIQTAPTDPLRYSLIIQPDSLAFASLSGNAHRVQLDYGACTFDAQGKALSYLHTSAEQILNPEEDALRLWPSIAGCFCCGCFAAVAFAAAAFAAVALLRLFLPSPCRHPERSEGSLYLPLSLPLLLPLLLPLPRDKPSLQVGRLSKS
jgi:hypothetical protein